MIKLQHDPIDWTLMWRPHAWSKKALNASLKTLQNCSTTDYRGDLLPSPSLYLSLSLSLPPLCPSPTLLSPLLMCEPYNLWAHWQKRTICNWSEPKSRNRDQKQAKEIGEHFRIWKELGGFIWAHLLHHLQSASNSCSSPYHSNFITCLQRNRRFCWRFSSS